MEQKNKKSGILVVNLPSVRGSQICTDDDEKRVMGPEISWSPIQSYERYDYLPKRIVENIKKDGVKISVVDYERIINNPDGLKELIHIAYNRRTSNDYDLRENMKRTNA
jgi:hypothetical protein